MSRVIDSVDPEAVASTGIFERTKFELIAFANLCASDAIVSPDTAVVVTVTVLGYESEIFSTQLPKTMVMVSFAAGVPIN